MNNRLLLLFFFLIIIIGYVYFSMHKSQTSVPQPTPPTQQGNTQDVKGAQIGARIKTSGCQVNGSLPDSACTPGGTDPRLTKDILCSPDFTTKSVRNVPAAEKREVYTEYGIPSHQPGQYEVDHLISLELGGSNDIANLWPEAADPLPGFHEKDLVENYLHRQVCNGSIALEVAQREIATNWLQIYQSATDIQNYK